MLFLVLLGMISVNYPPMRSIYSPSSMHETVEWIRRSIWSLKRLRPKNKKRRRVYVDRGIISPVNEATYQVVWEWQDLYLNDNQDLYLNDNNESIK